MADSREIFTSQSALHPPELERRHLSVVFSDLVDSTALSQELDPEELSGIIYWYHNTCHRVMESFGGHVANYIGDGILTYFGWPQAAEDDAERSVHAALSLVQALSENAPDGRKIGVRVAIATGLVVVRTISALGGKGDIVGETPNLAARLQSIAAPNTVVIAPDTWRLVGDMFEYRDLGKHNLKGIANPVQVRQVLRARPVSSRFEGYRQRALLPLVGREAQFSTLLDAWDRASRGSGQTVLIWGEPGIGKSRLVHELCRRIDKDDVAVLRYQCSSLHTTTALYPIIEQMRIAAGLSHGETADERVEKIARLIADTGRAAEPALALVCNLLQIRSPKVPRVPDLNPPQLREQLIETLWSQALKQSERGPVLAILEDVHWMDPTTGELMLRAISRLPRYPICLFATSREPFPEGWRSFENTNLLALERLNAVESSALARFASSGNIEDQTIERIVARTDGIPLFLEEMTRAICDAPANAFRVPRSEEQIPSTLQALLAERLDHIGNSKYLAQVGSIFGREFDVNALLEISGWPNTEFERGIANLVTSGLIRRHQISDRFSFKHSLMRDAAYDSILNSERKRLHRSALDYLEAAERNAISNITEDLAFHAERGQVWDKAAQYFAAACGNAIAKSANREAIALFDRALAALNNLPADKAAPYAIDLRLRGYAPLLAMGDVERLIEVMREADQLARLIGDKRRQAATFSQLASGLWLSGQHRAGLEHAEIAERLASEVQDFSIGLAARFNRATLHHALGMVREAAEVYSSILDTLQGDLQYKRFGWTALPSVLTCGFLTWCAVDLGEFPLAKQTIDRAMRIVDAIPEPYSLVYAHLANGLYQMGLANAHDAVTAFQAAKDVAETSQMQLPIATAWLAAAYVQAGRAQEALSLLTVADKAATYKHGGMYNRVHHHVSLAQAYLQVGKIDKAQEAITRAQEMSVSAEEVVHLALACKVQGDIATVAMTKGGEIARDAYNKALSIAKPRGLRPLEAHCYAGLALLTDRLGLASEAACYRGKAEQVYRTIGLPYPPGSYLGSPSDQPA